MREFEIIKLNDDSFSIEAGFVRFFLLKGTEKALLLDSGIEIDCVRALARTILKEAEPGGALDKAAPEESVFFSEETVQEKGKEEILPIELLNTHGDGDHCFGNREFDWFYMHEADQALYRRQFGEQCDIVSVEDGAVLDLGNRPLKIIHIPGHTYGSIAILDVRNRALFSGDSVQSGDIFMFGDHRNLDEYPASLIKLEEMEEEFDAVYASHAALKLDPEYVGECFDACESMFHGEVEGREEERHGTKIKAYDCGACTFLVDLDREFAEDDDE